VHETAVASKILARVRKVYVAAGDQIARGDLLVELDDEDMKSIRDEAEARLEQAKATQAQAQTEFDRIERLLKQNAASKVEYDRTRTALLEANAKLQQARSALKLAETNLGYTRSISPLTGIVSDERVEEGDTAKPGQVLVDLYDPTHMQLVARVRESLTRRLKVGQPLPVRVDALGLRCEGEISEIVPEAATASRTFEVKVTGPCPPGAYAGMFGRLEIPLDSESVLVIPRSAVRQVGQLNVVQVGKGGSLERRAVQLGRTFGDDIQVLSGLRPGEQVAVNPVDDPETPRT
jgi:RND family efflux transporter MFP subunit